jgi:hypothetical protein
MRSSNLGREVFVLKFEPHKRARPLCTKCLFVCLFSFLEGARGGAGKLGQVLEFFSRESGSAQLWD